jgi:hypothetical protein
VARGKAGTKGFLADLTGGMQRRRLKMSKILIGVATAALWFALSHVANAEQVRQPVCGDGTFVSTCADHPDSGVAIHAPGVGIDIGR